MLETGRAQRALSSLFIIAFRPAVENSTRGLNFGTLNLYEVPVPRGRYECGGAGVLIAASIFSLIVFAAVVLCRRRRLRDLPRVPEGRRSVRSTKYYLALMIVDNYRWLEDGNSPDTQKWVAEEMAYTRKLLDPLPGREAIQKRLTELLSIGSISAPEMAGKYYFYTRREGMQNQPVLYVRGRKLRR